MLTLGVLGLTSYCRKKLTDDYERALKETKRKQSRISVTCEDSSVEVRDATPDQQQTCTPGLSWDFSMELLNGSSEEVANILKCELVRLTWANRAALKGRIVVLNSESKYLDTLLRRAAAEDVGGFAICSKNEHPLETHEIEVFLQRVQDAFTDVPFASVPPVWLVFGGNASSLMAANSPQSIRVSMIHDCVPIKDEVFLLPGAELGHYDSTWVPDVVAKSLSKNEAFSTLDSLAGIWSWISTEINITECESKQELSAQMMNVELYNESRYLF
eukprot:gnl/MRDRNA2_/MRDRNA2_103034_c0_seq1.p1 gnl/MRDRNA2_/MRDRNA2_103034_c0~~gnl/MRDRNA2_/MRDRNA2_103034_c0_seq1.p1  ORF type:complete len:273 (+),score=59.38 gnl/MRDRNA2_/MRDRNA2_103034_c0_seq1:143-961(+)